jgi:hypothetical protein
MSCHSWSSGCAMYIPAYNAVTRSAKLSISTLD